MDTNTYEMVAGGLIQLGLVRPKGYDGMEYEEACAYLDRCESMRLDQKLCAIEMEVCDRWCFAWENICRSMAPGFLVKFHGARRPSNWMGKEETIDQMGVLNTLIGVYENDEFLLPVIKRWREGHSRNLMALELAEAPLVQSGVGRSKKKNQKSLQSKAVRDALKGKPGRK